MVEHNKNNSKFALKTPEINRKDYVDRAKEEIVNAGLEKLPIYHKEISGDKLVGTMYMVEKTGYSFHIYFIYEPNSTRYSGKDGILAEMYYDLRNKKYWVKRNFKRVSFSERNISSMLPNVYEYKNDFFNFISTDENHGLYEHAYRKLGARGNEYVRKLSRFLYRLIKKHSYVELLYKAGVRGSYTVHNASGKNPREILGLSNSQWKLFTRYNISIKAIQNSSYSNQAVVKMLNYLNYVSKLSDEFGIDRTSVFFNNEMSYLGSTSKSREGIYNYRHIYSTIRISEEHGLSANRLIRYIYFECYVSQGMEPNEATRYYKDYMDMVKDMGLQNYDKYPKFLKTQHDIVRMNYNISLKENEEKIWNSIINDNSWLEWSNGDYVVMLPQKPEDLRDEGNQLAHCVASYVNKIVNKSSLILFLRKKEDIKKSLITVELMNNAIVQARGKFNQLPKKDEVSALEKFVQDKGLELSTLV